MNRQSSWIRQSQASQKHLDIEDAEEDVGHVESIGGEAGDSTIGMSSEAHGGANQSLQTPEAADVEEGRRSSYSNDDHDEDDQHLPAPHLHQQRTKTQQQQQQPVASNNDDDDDNDTTANHNASKYAYEDDSVLLWSDDPEKEYFAYMLSQEQEQRARKGKSAEDSLIGNSTIEEIQMHNQWKQHGGHYDSGAGEEDSGDDDDDLPVRDPNIVVNPEDDDTAYFPVDFPPAAMEMENYDDYAYGDDGPVSTLGGSTLDGYSLATAEKSFRPPPFRKPSSSEQGPPNMSTSYDNTTRDGPDAAAGSPPRQEAYETPPPKHSSNQHHDKSSSCCTPGTKKFFPNVIYVTPQADHDKDSKDNITNDDDDDPPTPTTLNSQKSYTQNQLETSGISSNNSRTPLTPTTARRRRERMSRTFLAVIALLCCISLGAAATAIFLSLAPQGDDDDNSTNNVSSVENTNFNNDNNGLLTLRPAVEVTFMDDDSLVATAAPTVSPTPSTTKQTTSEPTFWSTEGTTFAPTVAPTFYTPTLRPTLTATTTTTTDSPTTSNPTPTLTVAPTAAPTFTATTETTINDDDDTVTPWCGCSSCKADLLDAMADEFPCAVRIEFLIYEWGFSEREACIQVNGMEFPDVCSSSLCNPEVCNDDNNVEDAAAIYTAAASLPPQGDERDPGNAANPVLPAMDPTPPSLRPTQLPTSLPTIVIPTTPRPSSLKLRQEGNDGQPLNAFPLGRCEGKYYTPKAAEELDSFNARLFVAHTLCFSSHLVQLTMVFVP